MNIEDIAKPKSEDDQEPEHFNYQVTLQTGESYDYTGYVIITGSSMAICQEGYIHFACPWPNVRALAKV